MKKYQENVKMCGRGSFVRFYGVRVGMATWANKLALSLSLESVCLILTF